METAPTGYNSIGYNNDGIWYITISEADSSGNVTITITNSNGDKIAEYDTSTTNNSSIIDVTSGVATVAVENSSGSTLPSTGGMGTKIFYTLGGILVVGAGVLLIVKRRMRSA